MPPSQTNVGLPGCAVAFAAHSAGVTKMTVPHHLLDEATKIVVEHSQKKRHANEIADYVLGGEWIIFVLLSPVWLLLTLWMGIEWCVRKALGADFP